MLEHVTVNGIVATGLVVALIVGMCGGYDVSVVNGIVGALAGVLIGKHL
ncbi:hypothetical protein [Selenomonas sp. AE3005]|nr:hypothetical protein [Selenomonas sp. AE3005]